MTSSSLLWLTPLLSFTVGLAMLLLRSRRLLAALDVAGSLTVLGLTLEIARRVVQCGPLGALGIFRADQVAVLAHEACRVGAGPAAAEVLVALRRTL